MNEFSMTELRDMAPAYVLGALSDEENVAFERALATSHELMQEVNAYKHVVTQIGTVREVSPPPAIRARFLDKIATQKTQAGGAQAAETPAAPTSAAEPEQRPFTVSTGGAPAAKPASEKPQRERGWFTGVIAVGLAASLVFAIQRNSQVSSLSTQLAQRDSILEARTTELAQRDSTLNTILEAKSNLVLVNLVQAPDSGPAMQFFWNVKQGRGVLSTAGLKPADAGRVYQLWLIKDGKAVPSRTFNTGSDNRSLELGIELPTTTSGVSAVAITVEPAGGSLQPTTTPFLVGELPKAPQ